MGGTVGVTVYRLRRGITNGQPCMYDRLTIFKSHSIFSEVTVNSFKLFFFNAFNILGFNSNDKFSINKCLQSTRDNSFFKLLSHMHTYIV